VKIMDIDRSEKRPGGTVDSWCGKCKMMLAHTIEAMVGDKPARVNCNTCRSQHSYKANPPGESSRPTRVRAEGEKPVRQSKSGAKSYQSLLLAKNAAAAKTYSPTGTYEVGDVLDHHVFGRGIATAVRDGTKVEVLFESGSKTLIHSR
jgi:hypothetical protein